MSKKQLLLLKTKRHYFDVGSIAHNCQLQAVPHCFVAQVITITNH
jgi:hypothetical protein